jgi:hypothetical protein
MRALQMLVLPSMPVGHTSDRDASTLRTIASAVA